ncbi:MAG: DUF3175 domain-containing protein, partial [Deltaproteobacteria bacterium]
MSLCQRTLKRRPGRLKSRKPKPRRRAPRDVRQPRRYWSHRVTQTSNALDLESGVFTKSNPRAVARSLKQSAETSTRRRSSANPEPGAAADSRANEAGVAESVRPHVTAGAARMSEGGGCDGYQRDSGSEDEGHLRGARTPAGL